MTKNPTWLTLTKKQQEKVHDMVKERLCHPDLNGRYSRYAFVAHHKDWIRKTTKKSTCKTAQLTEEAPDCIKWFVKRVS